MATPVSRAHKMFIRWEPYVALLLASGFFSWLGKKLTVFGELGWPESIFIGVGAASLVAFALSAGLQGWRVFRPLPAVGAQPNATASVGVAPGYDETQLRRDMEGVDTRLTGSLDGLKEHVRSEDESLRMYLEVLEGRLTDLTARSQAQQGALLAIYHRERMLALAERIDRQSLELGKPLAEGKVVNGEEWEAWKAERQQWESVVYQWAQYAGFYLGREPMDDIKRINSEGLDENWGARADQFPSDPEGLRIYKIFRIHVRNWANISKVAHDKVRRMAFEGTAV